jgi:plastocyanin
VKQNGPVIRWTLGANGSSDYTFTGPGFVSSTNDPTLYVSRGHTYIFVNSSGGSHPFEIRTSFNGSAYSSGVTNNGASSGAVVFTVPMNAPSTLYYQCTSHSNMGNTINILS